MVREIVTDIDFLEKPLEKVESAEEVKELARDLLDTAKHHGKRCLGLSANQIGGTKKVVAVKIAFPWRAHGKRCGIGGWMSCTGIPAITSRKCTAPGLWGRSYSMR